MSPIRGKNPAAPPPPAQLLIEQDEAESLGITNKPSSFSPIGDAFEPGPILNGTVRYDPAFEAAYDFVYNTLPAGSLGAVETSNQVATQVARFGVEAVEPFKNAFFRFYDELPGPDSDRHAQAFQLALQALGTSDSKP